MAQAMERQALITTIRKRWQCDGCGSLWQQEEVALRCCGADEVYLCGKRIKKSYGLIPCVHWDKNDARKCQRTDKRLKRWSDEHD